MDRLEHYRRRYAALQPGWTHATARYQAWVNAHLTPTTHVLDLGCGRGGIVERLGGTGRWIGVDPDLPSLREHRRPTLPRLCARSEQLPFADETFDLVIASWLLEHLPDPAATFREVGRVLRPGGYFIFLTPNARHPLPRLSRVLAPLHRLQQWLTVRLYHRAAADTFPVYYRANTPRTITHLALQAQLRLVQFDLVDDPAYFAWNELSFRLALLLERWLPPLWKVHLVGEYVRSA